MKSFLKPFSALLLAAAMLLAGLPVWAQPDNSGGTIYSMDDWAKDYIEIPSGRDSLQLTVAGGEAVSYKVFSGDSAKVSDAGLVTPNSTFTYWYGSTGYSHPLTDQEPDRVTSVNNYGQTVIKATSASGTKYITVNVEDYAEAYTNQQLDSFIGESITASMTAKQKLDAVCEYAADFPYNRSGTNAQKAVVMGGASESGIAELVKLACRRLGFKAWSFNIYSPYYGSSRSTTVQLANDKFYTLKFVGSSLPRSFTITESSAPFDYVETDGGIKITRYDNKDDGETELAIPSKIDGKTVVAIGANSIKDYKLTKIVLPDTVEIIEENAFSSCYDLAVLNIPSSVAQIGGGAFSGTALGAGLTCDKGNINFTVENGVLYKRDKTELISAPSVSGVQIPSTVTKIAASAFERNRNIAELKIPGSVKNIGASAFLSSSVKKVELADGVQTIGDKAFSGSYRLESVVLPNSLTEIGDNLFLNSSSIKTVRFCGTQAQWTALTEGKTLGLPSGCTIEFDYIAEAEQKKIKGDVNEDGIVNGEDVVCVLKYAAGFTDSVIYREDYMDVNGDGTVNVKDATCIQKLIVELV